MAVQKIIEILRVQALLYVARSDGYQGGWGRVGQTRTFLIPTASYLNWFTNFENLFCLLLWQDFISDKFREFEQMEVNVRGTLSQIHNDALPAPARQKVTSMLNSLSK